MEQVIQLQFSTIDEANRIINLIDVLNNSSTEIDTRIKDLRKKKRKEKKDTKLVKINDDIKHQQVFKQGITNQIKKLRAVLKEYEKDILEQLSSEEKTYLFEVSKLESNVVGDIISNINDDTLRKKARELYSLIVNNRRVLQPIENREKQENLISEFVNKTVTGIRVLPDEFKLVQNIADNYSLNNGNDELMELIKQDREKSEHRLLQNVGELQFNKIAYHNMTEDQVPLIAGDRIKEITTKSPPPMNIFQGLTEFSGYKYSTPKSTPLQINYDPAEEYYRYLTPDFPSLARTPLNYQTLSQTQSSTMNRNMTDLPELNLNEGEEIKGNEFLQRYAKQQGLEKQYEQLLKGEDPVYPKEGEVMAPIDIGSRKTKRKPKTKTAKPKKSKKVKVEKVTKNEKIYNKLKSLCKKVNK